MSAPDAGLKIDVGGLEVEDMFDLGFMDRHHVYRIKSWTGLLLYVGCTNDVDRRLAEHARRSPWYVLGKSCESYAYIGQAAALSAERDAIRTERPLFNRVEYANETDHEAGLMRKAESDRELAWGLHSLFAPMFDEENLKAQAADRG